MQKLVIELLFFLQLTLLVACADKSMTASRKKLFEKFDLPEICDCKLSDMEMTDHYPVAAIGDSLVLCKLGTLNGEHWTKGLYGLQLYDHIRLYNCMTDSPIVFPDHYNLISYKDKSIHLWSKRNFSLFIAKNNTWEPAFEIPVYSIKVFAKNGKISSSAKELAFTPQQYSKKALQLVDSLYQLKLNHPASHSVASKLLMAAWNGDTLSARRLRNFKSTFSQYGSEKEVIELYLELLNNYDTLIQNGGKVNYLELPSLPIFENN